MAALISGENVSTSAEEIYGSLRHVVKPILEKISLSIPIGTASLKPAYFSLVPASLTKWYRRWLLLTRARREPTRRRMHKSCGYEAKQLGPISDSAALSITRTAALRCL